jgi:hypothetical protein
MAGSDHLLSKAFLCTGAAAYVLGQCVVVVAGTVLDPNQMVKATTGAAAANAPTPLGLVQENIDLVKVQTGKAYATVGLNGIAFGIWSGVGTLSVNAALIPSATVAGSLDAVAVGTTGRPMVGTYVGGGGGTSAAAAAGDIISVFLTPGARC